jgi:hypothetical protein
MRLAGSFVCAGVHLIDLCQRRAIPAHAESQSAAAALRRLRQQQRRGRSAKRGDGRCEASARSEAEGWARRAPFGRCEQQRVGPCAWWRSRSDTTLTGVQLGITAAGGAGRIRAKRASIERPDKKAALASGLTDKELSSTVSLAEGIGMHLVTGQKFAQPASS